MLLSSPTQPSTPLASPRLTSPHLLSLLFPSSLWRLQADEERVLLVELVPLSVESKQTEPEVPSSALLQADDMTGAEMEGRAGGGGGVGAGSGREIYRKSKLEGVISIELVEYDDALRKSYEQRLQEFHTLPSPSPPALPANPDRINPTPPPLSPSILSRPPPFPPAPFFTLN